MNPATTLFVAIALLPAITESSIVQRARYLMGTVCEVALSGPGADRQAELAFAEAERVESLLSTWSNDSELARVNRRESRPGPELAALLAVAENWRLRTEGAFDPRVGDLVILWRTRLDGAIPTAAAIRDALTARTDPNSLRYEEGGFGKGYALDRMLAGITADQAMIDFGGQIAVRGRFRVSIADPSNRSRPVVALMLADASISTSSGSEKTFEVAGRRFSHIIDPRSGEALPPRGSVSVIADDALTADILSTALYVMGEDDGLRWAAANGVAAIFINTTNQIRLSAPARVRVRELELLDRRYSFKD